LSYALGMVIGASVTRSPGRRAFTAL